MRMVKISRGGQISLPAEVRRRWATETLVAEDLGDRVVLWPVPEDPVAHARGSIAWKGSSLDEVRSKYRRDDRKHT